MLKKEDINLANMLSLSRVLFGALFLVVFIVMRQLQLSDLNILILRIVAIIIFIIGIVTDALDGYYARKHNVVTDTGKHLDPLTDSIFFVIVFTTFYILDYMPIYFLLIIIFREGFMHLFLRPFAKKRGESLPANIFGKTKTFCQSIFSILILIALIVIQGLKLRGFDVEQFNRLTSLVSLILFALIAFLSIFSLLSYIIKLKDMLFKK